ncbi:DUF3592 domain-containing protein [Actinomadura sediminis]|uniref:DUF3592 domain-containing protein n=1 Tax=Actinomadura sediminis TaxID=1038904 RepID=A0ABW3EK01_9ACTN
MNDRLLALARLVVFAVVLVLMGGLLAYTGGRDLILASTLRDRGRPATGTVLDTRERTTNSKNGGRYTELRVEFTAADGTRHAFWDRGEAAVGETVVVHYDPENPETVVIGAIPARSPAGFAMVAAGGTFILSPVLMILYYRRHPVKGAHAAGSRRRPRPGR